jgi:hypothetical protein
MAPYQCARPRHGSASQQQVALPPAVGHKCGARHPCNEASARKTSLNYKDSMNKRPRNTRMLSAITALLLIGCSESADSPMSTVIKPAAAVTSSVNVVSTVYDTDALGSLLFTRSDDKTGAGYASYAASSGRTGITSQITSTGSWQLYLGNQTARTLYLVLKSQGITTLEDGYYSANVEAFSRCYAADDLTELSLLNLTAGASYTNCSFGVDFTSGRTKYKLAMGPKFNATGRATVSCDAAAAVCTSWVIAPNESIPNTAVANLYHYGKNGSLIFDGVYRNSYFVKARQQ